MAKGILVNTFRELEVMAVKAVEDGLFSGSQKFVALDHEVEVLSCRRANDCMAIVSGAAC
ncbi:hypothetical protein L195_g051548 [Trifolium pratense]|uniref:Uncharacterized protein n=1 Tax=Trifolium pratense TaxID=57577 RepID=A0A2K3K0A6_TRIPR|nr:hypothetical protein L195_g051548 [Trifolium pratense]